ncbi:MAG: hypothetical protein EOR84_30605 [Mesorhizobium sp.]|uniref:hypothetical protein n=1 Tax=Mesorhizobium sp. TaxID=1871066 RepID=UPI000FE45EF4|nr:hypothetical protein [Mesorhizobium sp.]RWM86466.1 MAG: hypothetical protein EOR84_30605 [Mesorhizobium sp.]
MAFPDYMRSTETKIVDTLIKKALGLGYVVSVYDGMDWPVKKSADYEAITCEIAATDVTELVFRLDDGTKVGWMMLVHGNDEDVISDYSANPQMENLVAGIDT